MPRMMRPTNFGHAAGASSRTVCSSESTLPTLAPAGERRAEALNAATSRATPMIDRASPRLAVTFNSRTVSSSCRYSRNGVPSGASSGSSRMPGLESPRPSSLAEQSMPRESTPRSFAAAMFSPPGSCAPTLAKRGAQAGAGIGRAAHNLQRITRAGAHLADAQLVGLRVWDGRKDLRHHHTAERRRRRFHGLKLQARHGQARAQLGRRPRHLHPITQPGHRHFHGCAQNAANCSRKRRSFSKNNRMSFTP